MSFLWYDDTGHHPDIKGTPVSINQSYSVTKGGKIIATSDVRPLSTDLSENNLALVGWHVTHTTLPGSQLAALQSALTCTAP